MNNILHSSKSNEWYTPAEYIEAAREVMGNIDLDPASCNEANKIIKATMFKDLECDGLNGSWHGNVWLNPPYGKTEGRSNAGIWIDKLLEQYNCGNVQQAILLVNAVPDRKWFKKLWELPICFTDHRIKFISPEGGKNSPTHGHCFVYLPPTAWDWNSIHKFDEIFSQFGHIILP